VSDSSIGSIFPLVATGRGSPANSVSGRFLAQQRKRLVVRDPEQPPGEPGRILELGQVLVRLQKHVLADIHRVFPIRHQPQQIVEDALLPSGHQEVVRLHVSPLGLGDQVEIFDLAKDQLFSSVRKDAPRAQKVGKGLF
jgi:hypothetical protein